MKSFAGARCSAWRPRDATLLTLGPVSSRLSPLLTQPKAIDHVAWPPAHCPTSLRLSSTLVKPGHTWLPMSSTCHPDKTIHSPPSILIYLITGLTGTTGTSSRPWLMSLPTHGLLLVLWGMLAFFLLDFRHRAPMSASSPNLCSLPVTSHAVFAFLVTDTAQRDPSLGNIVTVSEPGLLGEGGENRLG